MRGPDGRDLGYRGSNQDVTDKIRMERALEHQLALQVLIAEISRTLVDTDSTGIEPLIEPLLERIGRFFGGDRCYLFHFDENAPLMRMTHEWCACGVEPSRPVCLKINLASVPWWAERMRSQTAFWIDDVGRLPPEAALERTLFEEQSIRSLASVPMTSQGVVIGALGIDLVGAPRSWHDEDIRMLQLIGEVIAGALVRVESDTALVTSENRYRQVTAIMSDVAYSCIHHPKHGYQIDWITRSIESLTGYDLDTMLAMGCWGSLVVDEDRALFDAKVVGLAPGETAHCELRLRHRDGSVRWVRVTNECLLEDADAGRRRLYGGLLDITESRRHAAEVERLALVVEQSPSMVMITDLAGRIEYVNRRFCELTGYRREEILDHSSDRLKPADRTLDEDDEVMGSLLRGETWSGELETRTKTGETRWEQAHVTPLRGQDGRITHYVKQAEDISERKALSQQLRYLAHYDPLTGLPNRVLMRERLVLVLGAARDTHEKLALLSIDLDDLRSVNDSLGQAAGDHLLCVAAQRWQALLRDEDTLARFSGDNFIVLASGLRQRQGAARLAERILGSLNEPILLDGQSVVVSCSIGISLYPEDADSPETLLGHADAALHSAKVDGRRRYRFYTPALNERLQEQFKLEQALRRAIEQDELLLHYQPRVDIATGRILGLEALIRWHHPEWGLVAPDRFIPIAESSGLIRRFGPLVARLACAQMQRWATAGIAPVQVAVNLSSAELYDEALAQQIVAIVTAAGLDPKLLAIEVTESAAMRSIEQAIAILGQLRAAGFSLAIDDFGTGYASLSYLNRLPAQALKIDRSFLAEVASGGPGESQAAAIVKAVIGLGRTLGLEVIAEGVETQGQRHFLLEHGCREAQGYLFSRPLPAESVEALLRRGYIPLDADEVMTDPSD